MINFKGENRDALNLDYGVSKSSSSEGMTAKRELLVIAKDLYDLYMSLNKEDDLPEWCHYKIATSKSELSAVSDYITAKIMQHDLDSNKLSTLRLESKRILRLNENFLSNMMKKFKKKEKQKEKEKSEPAKDNTSQKVAGYSKSDLLNTLNGQVPTQPISAPDTQPIDPNLAPTLPVSNTLSSKNTSPSGPPSFQGSPAPQVKNNQTKKKSHSTLRTNRGDILSEVTNNDILQILVNLKLLMGYLDKFTTLSNRTSEIESELENSSYGDSIKTYLDNLSRVFVMLFQPLGYYDIVKNLYKASMSLNESSNENSEISNILRYTASDAGIALNHKKHLLASIDKMNVDDIKEKLISAKESLDVDKISTLLRDYHDKIIEIGKIIKNLIDKNPHKNMQDDILNDAIDNYNSIDTKYYNKKIGNYSYKKRKYYSYQKIKEANLNPYITFIKLIKPVRNYYIKGFDNNLLSDETFLKYYEDAKQKLSPEKVDRIKQNMTLHQKNLNSVISFIDQVSEEIASLLKESRDPNIIYNFISKLDNNLRSLLLFPQVEKKSLEIINNITHKTKLLLFDDMIDYMSSNKKRIVNDLMNIKKDLSKVESLVSEILEIIQ